MLPLLWPDWFLCLIEVEEVPTGPPPAVVGRELPPIVPDRFTIRFELEPVL